MRLLVTVNDDQASDVEAYIANHVNGVIEVSEHGDGCCCKNCPWQGNHEERVTPAPRGPYQSHLTYADNMSKELRGRLERMSSEVPAHVVRRLVQLVEDAWNEGAEYDAGRAG